LFDYTPAHIFVMLDNVRTGELTNTWNGALKQLDRGRRDLAVAALDRAQCMRTEEGRKLREVLQAAMENHEAERITPHGLTAEDIIEYLLLFKTVEAHVHMT
jgi:hypothetical protein